MSTGSGLNGPKQITRTDFEALKCIPNVRWEAETAELLEGDYLLKLMEEESTGEKLLYQAEIQGDFLIAELDMVGNQMRVHAQMASDAMSLGG